MMHSGDQLPAAVQHKLANEMVRMTPRVLTYTGRRVNPLALRPSDVCIEDIAHALACLNRFAGHTREPISIAQHSWNVSHLCPSAPLQGLLHDGSEAYLGDVTKWVKESEAMVGYRVAERRAQAIVYYVFGCPLDEHPEIALADRFMVRFEATHGYENWDIGHPLYTKVTSDEAQIIGEWEPWDWRTAERRFLERFEELR